ncbi:MAG: sodium:solute symporter [Desulfitibacter sp. BRH_c19]|nr:MAG: sodium:solute symporter [Desulfitibacter sp. BRH_c19]
MNNILLYGLIILYLAIVAGLTYLAYSRTKSSKDYLIAGGNAHPFLMAMAYGSTFISTSAIIGFGGAAALFGMGMMWLAFLNIFVGIFLAFILFGKPTLRLSKELNVSTFPELLGKRYDSKFIQQYAAVIISLTMPLYAAAVMIGAAWFLQLVLDVPYSTTVWIFGIIVGIYVMTGGLKGVFYNDAFQGTLMFVGMFILLIATYIQLGGVTNAHMALTNLAHLVPENLVAQGHQGWTQMPKFISEQWWVLVSTLVLGVGIGVLAQPQLIVRYMTVKGPKELNRAVAIGGVFIIMMTGVAFLVGSLTNVYFHQNLGQISLAASVDPVTNVANIDRIIPLYINMAMPEWFSYLLLLTLLAAAMSTLSGQFHAIGTSISHDLYKSSGLLGHRGGIIVALLATVWLCFKLPPSIIAISTAMFFGICASTFLPAYSAALFWKKATRSGAIASMIVGSFANILYMMFIHAKEANAIGISKALFDKSTLLSSPWTVVDPMLVSLPIAAFTLVVVSLLTQEQESDVTQKTALAKSNA